MRKLNQIFLTFILSTSAAVFSIDASESLSNVSEDIQLSHPRCHKRSFCHRKRGPAGATGTPGRTGPTGPTGATGGIDAYAFFYTKITPDFIEEVLPETAGTEKHIVEFQDNNFTPGHANIIFPAGAIIPHHDDSGNPQLITSFTVLQEGDYLITFYVTTENPGGNTLGLVTGGNIIAPGSFTSPGSYTTAQLDGFTQLDPTPQGTRTRELSTFLITHLKAGETVSLVNLEGTRNSVIGSITADSVIASIIFQLLRAGGPSPQ